MNAIGAMHATVRAARAEDGARVARVHQGLGPRLGPALDGLAPGRSEVVIVREVDVEVALPASGDADALARRWVEEITRAVAAQVIAGRPDRVVRFASPLHAVQEAGRHSALSRRELAWAWERLGLAPASASPERLAGGVVEWLAARPELAAPALAGIARTGDLAGFVARAGTAAVARLADLVVAAPAARRDVAEPGAATVAGGGWWEVAGAVEVVWLRRSAIAAAVLAEPALRRPEVLPHLAALALREAFPGSTAAPAVVAFATELLRTGAYEETAGRSSAPAAGGAAAPARPEIPAPADDPVAEAGGDGAPPHGEPSAPPAPPVAPVVHRTPFGGLLYLINLLSREGMFDALVPALPERPVSWVLHHLGRALAPIEAADPALAVFSGHHPGAPLPSAGPEPDPAELDGLGAGAARAGEAVAALLPADLPDPLDWLVGRPAVIEATDGWVEARFPEDAVSVEVRLAGLDLDPGFVPWLGTVVRFAYG